MRFNQDPSPDPIISTRIPYIRAYQDRGYKIDWKLLNECAYYPREGCQDCKWDWPLQECQFAHILVATRIKELKGWQAKSKAGKGKKQTTQEKFWKSLSKELQEELKELMKGGEEI